MVLVVMATIALVIATILQCKHIPDAWNDNLTFFNHCIDLSRFWWANSLWNICSDTLLILVPVPVVRKLQISFAKKVGLVVMFNIGTIVILTAVLRFTTLKRAAQNRGFDGLQGTNLSTLWTQAEVTVAVICANIPMLRQLLSFCIPALGDTTHRRTAPQQGVNLPDWPANRQRRTANDDLSTADEEDASTLLSDPRKSVATS